MDSRGVRTALCACLIAVSTSRACAFAPGVHHVTAPCAAGGAPGSRSVTSSPPRGRTSGTARYSSSSSGSSASSSGSGGVTPGPGETTPPSSSVSAAAPGGAPTGNPLVADSRRKEAG
ncbi:unnamed protein product, partial [Laminaria digitata]